MRSYLSPGPRRIQMMVCLENALIKILSNVSTSFNNTYYARILLLTRCFARFTVTYRNILSVLFASICLALSGYNILVFYFFLLIFLTDFTS